MSRQYQLLAKLQKGDPEAVVTLMTGCGEFLTEYCAVRLGNFRRGEEVAFHLFTKWLMDRFASATFPLADWMAKEAEAECCRWEVALN
jgi:hypothetical protein